MAERSAPYRSRSYPGGVNDKLFGFDVPDQQATKLQNASTALVGVTKVRPGSELVATHPSMMGPIKGLGVFYPKEGVEESVLLAVCPNTTAGGSDPLHHTLWKWPGSGQWSKVGTLTGYTTTDLDVTLVQHYDIAGLISNRHCMVMRSNQDFGVPGYYYDGSTLAATWFGETLSPPAPHPSSAALESAFYRLFGAGSGDSRNRLFFSPVGSGTLTGFGTASAYTFGGASRGLIVAVKQFREQNLIIFMDDKIEVLVIADKLATVSTSDGSEYTNWSRDVVDPTIGCGSRRSIATVGKDILFADQFGNIRSIVRTIQDRNQGTESLPVSDAIQGTIDRINAQYIDKIAAASYDRFYYVAFPVGADTTPSEIWRFDVTRRAWDGPWTGLDPAMFASGKMTSSSASSADQGSTLYLATNEESYGKVIKLNRGTDDSGTAIAFEEVTKRINLQTLELKKRWSRLEVYAKATADVDITVEANVDNTGWTTLGTMNVLGSAPILPVTVTFTLGGTGVVDSKFNLEDLAHGTDIQFRFSASTSQDIQILGFTMTAFVEPFEYGVTVN